MDYIPSIFHFDQSDHHDLLQFSDHNLLSKPFEDCSDLTRKSDNSERRKASNSFVVNDDSPADGKKRKIIHRDIERQRRQDMSALYRTLRSLLPFEYLKGKRSISDHMHEAVNYIKDLQNKVQELSEKREELRRLSDTPTCSSGSECSQSHPEDSITVRPCLGGVEVAVSTAFKNGLPISTVLKLLNREGLSIVNCISTRMNETLLHNIISELNDGRSIDFLELQQKIIKLTSSSLD